MAKLIERNYHKTMYLSPQLYYFQVGLEKTSYNNLVSDLVNLI